MELLAGLRRAAAVLPAVIMLTSATPNVGALAQATSTAAPVALTETTIKALQEALNRQGIAAKADGILTEETRAAIRQYQSQHHLPVTGEPDKATLDKLGVAVAPATGAALSQRDQAAGMPMMPMRSMMAGDNPMMMGMMRMMGAMEPGRGGMSTIDRVEGRIAFLRTELKITDAQTNAWNGFAYALRANASRLGEVRRSMMSQREPTLAQRLDLQERWLLARVEGTRSIKAAFTDLYGALSDEQRKTADEILAPHMGMGIMMMPGPMGSGGR